MSAPQPKLRCAALGILVLLRLTDSTCRLRRPRASALRVIDPPFRDFTGPLLGADFLYGNLRGSRITYRAPFPAYQPSLCPSKVMIVDDSLVTMGSFHFDHRARRLNDGLNINVSAPGTARAFQKPLADALARSQPLAPADSRGQPLCVKWADHSCGLFRPFP